MYVCTFEEHMALHATGALLFSITKSSQMQYCLPWCGGLVCSSVVPAALGLCRPLTVSEDLETRGLGIRDWDIIPFAGHEAVGQALDGEPVPEHRVTLRP